MYGFNPRHTNANPFETTISKSNVSQLTVKWRRHNTQWSSPVVVNNILYSVASNTLYALNATSGKKLWSFNLGNGYGGFTPTVVNNAVYAMGNQQLFALNATTGKQIWSVPFDTFNSVSPLVVNNVLYVGSTDQNMYAFNAQTGAVLWKYMISTPGDTVSFAAPAYNRGVLYVEAAIDNTSYNYMYALNATTGASLWTVELDDAGGAVPSSPTVVNGVVYYMSVTTLQNGNCSEARIGALQSSNGQSLWMHNYGYCNNSALAYSHGVLYFSLADAQDPYTYAYALDATTGNTKWQYMTNSDHLNRHLASTPAIANGIAYMALNNRNFYAFDAQTGSILWQYATGLFAGPPIVVNGMVYAPADTLYAFGLPGM